MPMLGASCPTSGRDALNFSITSATVHPSPSGSDLAKAVMRSVRVCEGSFAICVGMALNERTFDEEVGDSVLSGVDAFAPHALDELSKLRGREGLAAPARCGVFAAGVDVDRKVAGLGEVAFVALAEAALDLEFAFVRDAEVAGFFVGALAEGARVCLVRPPAEIPQAGAKDGEGFPNSGIPAEAGGVGVEIEGEHSLRGDEECGVVVEADIVFPCGAHRVAVVAAHAEDGDGLCGGGDAVLREDLRDELL